MNENIERLKSIYKPVAFCSMGLIIIYSLLNYILIIKLRLFEINEEFIEFYLPLSLSIILVLILLRPIINHLDLGRRAKDFWTFFSVALVTVPIIVFQNYLNIETGKLTRVSNPSEIIKLPLTKYYAITNYYIDFKNYCFSDFTDQEAHGYNISSYYAAPLKSSEDQINTDTWFCCSYHDVVNVDSLNKPCFDNNRTKFLVASDMNDINHFERLNKSNEYDKFSERVRKNSRNDNIILLKPEYGIFIDRTGTLLTWSLSLFAFSNFVLFFIFIFVRFNEVANTKHKQKKSGYRIRLNRIKDNFIVLFPHHGYIATPVIIDINLLIFILMILNGTSFTSPGVKDIINWGGNLKDLTLNGEYWRLVTCMFVHIGFLHLISNLLVLFFIGSSLEPVLGSYKFISGYFICGICASLCSVYFTKNAVCAGASGAIFGLCGILLFLLVSKGFNKKTAKSLLSFFGLLILANFNPWLKIKNIDIAAHLGGLASGFCFGILESAYRVINKKTR